MTTKAGILKAIRETCRDCFGGNIGEISACTSLKCHIWPFRFGKDPSPNPNKGKHLLDNSLQKKHHTEIE